MNISDLKVGDRIFTVSGLSYHSYVPSTVVKITPSGMLDLQVGDHIVRFNKRGDELGGDRLFGKHIDIFSFEERVALKLEEEKRRNAANLINQVVVGETVRAVWGKESMQRIVDELQAKLDAAKKAVAELGAM